MELANLNALTQNLGFMVFDQAETVLGIAVPGAASWTRKQIDKLTDWVKRPDIGMKGMVEDSLITSSLVLLFEILAVSLVLLSEILAVPLVDTTDCVPSVIASKFFLVFL